jgi:protein-tyrosine phosphatase
VNETTPRTSPRRARPALLTAVALALGACTTAPSHTGEASSEHLAQSQQQRVVPLSGGRNFRDLGGYATEDGRHVRWGRLYRSGALAGLTDEDYTYLGKLGIRDVFDFRSTSERHSEPTRWRIAASPQFHQWDYELDVGQLLASLASGGQITEETAGRTFLAFYERMPFSQRDRYRELFDEIMRGKTPLVFHCTAGKDRTGVAAALILTALGVPRETILSDFELTAQLLKLDPRVALKAAVSGHTSVSNAAAASTGSPDNPMRGLRPAVLKVFMSADRSLLEAVFRGIEQQRGSVMTYIETDLGVDRSELERMRTQLLE